MWGATSHARASATEYGDSASAWAYTGYSFDLYGDDAGTAQITIDGTYSVDVDGGMFSDASATVEAVVGEVIHGDDSFTFEPITSTTALTVSDSAFVTTHEDQPFSLTQSVTLEPGADYAVVLQVTTEAASSGGSATANTYSFDEDEGFQGYAAWDTVTIDWL